MSPISKKENEQLASWFMAQNSPEDIKKIFAKFIKIMLFVENITAKNRNLMQRLRESMGLSPKNESQSTSRQ